MNEWVEVVKNNNKKNERNPRTVPMAIPPNVIAKFTRLEFQVYNVLKQSTYDMTSPQIAKRIGNGCTSKLVGLALYGDGNTHTSLAPYLIHYSDHPRLWKIAKVPLI